MRASGAPSGTWLRHLDCEIRLAGFLVQFRRLGDVHGPSAKLVAGANHHGPCRARIVDLRPFHGAGRILRASNVATVSKIACRRSGSDRIAAADEFRPATYSNRWRRRPMSSPPPPCIGLTFRAAKCCSRGWRRTWNLASRESRRWCWLWSPCRRRGAAGTRRNPGPWLHMLLGTALVAASASAFNQLIERRSDALMDRTADRPFRRAGCIVARRLVRLDHTDGRNRLFGRFRESPTAVFGALTWFLYVAVYTPLKSKSAANTAIGAVAGAMPVLIGWAAAEGSFSSSADQPRAAFGPRRCFSSSTCGSSRTSWPSPGFTAANTRQPVCRCSRSLMRRAAVPERRPCWVRWRFCPSVCRRAALGDSLRGRGDWAGNRLPVRSSHVLLAAR